MSDTTICPCARMCVRTRAWLIFSNTFVVCPSFGRAHHPEPTRVSFSAAAATTTITSAGKGKQAPPSRSPVPSTQGKSVRVHASFCSWHTHTHTYTHTCIDRSICACRGVMAIMCVVIAFLGALANGLIMARIKSNESNADESA